MKQMHDVDVGVATTRIEAHKFVQSQTGINRGYGKVAKPLSPVGKSMFMPSRWYCDVYICRYIYIHIGIDPQQYVW